MIAIAVILPVTGLAILVAAAMLFIRRRKKKTSNVMLAPGERARSEMEQTTECAPAPAPPSYEMGDDALRPELDSREVR
jgi:LPXTG-motif cell wall-anchored protein